jgi:hypothetical protein
MTDVDRAMAALAAEFLDAYADRLGNDGCNDWHWPEGMPGDAKAFLRGSESGDWLKGFGPPNWWVARKLAGWLRDRAGGE